MTAWWGSLAELRVNCAEMGPQASEGLMEDFLEEAKPELSPKGCAGMTRVKEGQEKTA